MSLSSPGPESRALLAGARVVADAGSRSALAAALAGGVDWDRLVARARAEGTAALVLERLREIDARVPAPACAALEASRRNTWARNGVLTECWREAVTLLSAAGVGSLTLKGLALIHTVYPDTALRPMADIDLLVRRGDVDATTRVLRAAGYRTSGPELEVEEAFRGYRHFVREGVVIDLHWELAHYSRFETVVRVDHERLWKRARPLEVAGTPGLMPAPEDMLLHLALHLTLGSEFGRLIWFVDVDALLRCWAGRFDWDLALAEAKRWRVRAIVRYAVRVAEASFATPVPPEVLTRLGRRPVRSALVAAAIGDRLPPSVVGRLVPGRVYLAETFLMDRAVDVLRICWTSLFPSREWLRFHYAVASPSRLRLWRAVHPFRAAYLAARRFR